MRISDWSSDVCSSDLANAIRDHNLPTQQGTSIPATREGQIVALADKLDTLAGIFAIGQKPTASKDPYALRRAALGVLRICLDAELPPDLKELLHAPHHLQPAGKHDGPPRAPQTGTGSRWQRELAAGKYRWETVQLQ